MKLNENISERETLDREKRIENYFFHGLVGDFLSQGPFEIIF